MGEAVEASDDVSNGDLNSEAALDIASAIVSVGDIGSGVVEVVLLRLLSMKKTTSDQQKIALIKTGG